jgi:purine-nucleoside phosphorylase
VDVFYNSQPDYASKMRSRNVVAVEMEAAALFFLAMRERGRGKDVRGACILTVSDTLVKDDESYGADYMSLDDLEAATRRMIEIALEAGTRFQ